MAHHISAKKRIRSNEKKRVENRYYAKTMRNALRDFRALEDKQVATERLPKMVSVGEMRNNFDKKSLATGKRLGFRFQADTD